MQQVETMERIMPDLMRTGDKAAQLSLKLHLERYHFACQHLLPGRVLDIACGTGYGTRQLAECSGNACIGVDVSFDAIAYATNRYAHPDIRFICEDVLQFTDAGRFQNIVSLETIEHLQDPAVVVAHLYELLLPGGRLIASAPVTPSVDANPYHVNDFTARSFRALFAKHKLAEVASLVQRQPYSIREIFSKKTGRTSNARKGLVRYYLSNPGKFFLRIRSLLTDGLNNHYLVLVLQKQG
ncbi:MAG TPA: class I SAM-dependent methyltransferase [Chitinophagaceae bacterium]|nr:class I SAM-dependent methyltransferase [Chitinophagaceae bacterium]